MGSAVGKGRGGWDVVMGVGEGWLLGGGKLAHLNGGAGGPFASLHQDVWLSLLFISSLYALCLANNITADLLSSSLLYYESSASKSL